MHCLHLLAQHFGLTGMSVCWPGSRFSTLYCRVMQHILPAGSNSKVSAYNAGDPGSVPGLGRSPEEGNGNPLQYSCLENPMDRGAWQATVHKVAKSQIQLGDFTFSFLQHSES